MRVVLILAATLILAGCGTSTAPPTPGPSPTATPKPTRTPKPSPTPIVSPSTTLRDVYNLGDWAKAEPRGCHALIRLYVPNLERSLAGINDDIATTTRRYLTELRADCWARHYDDVKLAGELMMDSATAAGYTISY